MTGKPEVIIVGAGIAGLTLALELPRVGIGSRVYEPARRLEPLGAGINVLPRASRILDRLGLAADLATAVTATFARGDGHETSAAGKALVACDGVHSAVRRVIPVCGASGP